MRVLITRAEPQASATAASLQKLGYVPVVFPLFEIVDTKAPIPSKPVDGYVFTSSNAVSVLERRGWQPENPQAAVFCIGRRTADRAKLLGFGNVIVGEGGGQNLLPKITGHGFHATGRLLYFTTPDRAFDLRNALSDTDIQVENVEIYQAVETNCSASELATTFSPSAPQIVLTYSRRSSDILAKHLTNAGLHKHLNNSILISISSQAIGALNTFEWRETRLPTVANEQAMFHILDNK